jgi:hypothetical protein
MMIVIKITISRRADMGEIWCRFRYGKICTIEVLLKSRIVAMIPFSGFGITEKHTFSNTRIKFIKARTKVVNIINTPTSLWRKRKSRRVR